ncbi:MAG TPA: hypothetical protein VGR73_05620 [Bryobacteraceae bacterium]|nr:hypothetical protein [Bryobacteraceae bacterium]
MMAVEAPTQIAIVSFRVDPQDRPSWGHCGRRQRSKYGNVTSFGQLDAHRVAAPVVLIVIAQPGAKPGCFDAYYGIRTRIVLVSAGENSRAHHIFLDLVSSASESFLDDIPQKAARRFDGGEGTGGQNALKLRADPFRLNRSVGSGKA